MSDQFLKSLIALLAQSGGQITLPMRDLQTLGLQVTLSDIFSDNAASLTLRLAAKIYYVPAATASEEAPEWQTAASTNPASAPSTTSPPDGPFHRGSQYTAVLASHEIPSVEDQIAAVNSLNNRPPLRVSSPERKRKKLRNLNPRPPIHPSPEAGTLLPAGQHIPGQPPPQQPAAETDLPPLPSSGPPRSIRKDDLSLFLREQAIQSNHDLHAEAIERQRTLAAREFPWENRTNGKPPPARAG